MFLCLKRRVVQIKSLSYHYGIVNQSLAKLCVSKIKLSVA